MLCLSVRQPWVYAIFALGKDIENRDWKPWNSGLKVRGRVLIHASATFGPDDRYDIQSIREIYRQTGRDPEQVPYPRKSIQMKHDPYVTGALAGTVEIVDCVSSHPSPWFFGPHGFVLAEPRPFARPIPLKARLGFFDVPITFLPSDETDMPQRTVDHVHRT